MKLNNLYSIALRIFTGALFLVLAGCPLSDIDFAGKSCPCGSGWVCDDQQNVCVPESLEPDDGSVDMDASVMDASPGEDGSQDGDADDSGDAGDADDSGDADDANDSGDAGDGSNPDPTSCDDLGNNWPFCYSVEGASITPPWNVSTFCGGGGSVCAADRIVAPSPVYRGVGTLRASVSLTGSASLTTDDLMPMFPDVDAKEAYARAYLYISPTGTVTTQPIFRVGSTTTADGAHIEFNGNASSGTLRVVMDTTATPSASVAVNLNEWVCIEVYRSTESGVAEFWINGTSAGTSTTLAEPAPLTTIMTKVSAQGPITVYADEIIADAFPIGCD